MGFNWLRIKFSDWILTSIDGGLAMGFNWLRAGLLTG
jgi:hypothetical protein